MSVAVVEIGPGEFTVTIVETAGATATVVQIDGVPIVGTVRRIQAQLESGAGTTIDPILGRTATPSTAIISDVVLHALSTPAATADRCGAATYVASTITGGLGTLWHMSRPDAGSNNAITTVYHITAGW